MLDFKFETEPQSIMQFGPVTAYEIDSIVQALQKREVPFEIVVDEDGMKRDLADTPDNILAYAEYRTKTQLSQHFYFEVSDVWLVNHNGLEEWIHSLITNQVIPEELQIHNDPEDPSSSLDEIRPRSFIYSKRLWAGVILLYFLISFLWGRFGQ